MNTMSINSAPLPLAVQVGFAGSRTLFDVATIFSPTVGNPNEYLLGILSKRLSALPTELGIAAHSHFLCGISQVAIGADSLFAKAMQQLGWLHRALLPQPRDEYLSANGSNGPDFSPEQRTEAIAILGSDQVIEERVASRAADRSTRFGEVNVEIAQFSDVVVALRGVSGNPKPGGTDDLVQIAERRGRPVLKLTVVIEDGVPRLEEEWVNQQAFVLPQLPSEMHDATLTKVSDTARSVSLRPVSPPSLADYCAALKGFASLSANRRRKVFKWFALIIILAHLTATLLASLALILGQSGCVPWLLGIELVCLTIGIVVHSRLHSTHLIRAWVLTRVVAELVESVKADQSLPIFLDHLFNAPLPPILRPVLRTLNILHLAQTKPRGLPIPNWDIFRKAYHEQRLTGIPRTQGAGHSRAQIPYYSRSGGTARRNGNRIRIAFRVLTMLAITATTIKFLKTTHVISIWPWLADTLSVYALVFPTAAVAAMALGASLDFDGREHSFAEMRDYLEKASARLAATPSEAEFRRLVTEIEGRLLSEHANWASRRIFVSVT